jgi:hypothetical protein
MMLQINDKVANHIVHDHITSVVKVLDPIASSFGLKSVFLCRARIVANQFKIAENLDQQVF